MENFSLNHLNLNSKFHVYDNYEFKKDDSFLTNDFYIRDGSIFGKYHEWHTREFIPNNFYNAPLYVESENGEVKLQKDKNKKGYAYLIAKNIFLDAKSDNDVFEFLSLKDSMNAYDFEAYGKAFYTALAKNNFSSFNGLLSFVKTWGLLTGISASYFPTAGIYTDLNILFMKLETLYSKIEDYQRIFGLFEALVKDDFSNVSSPWNPEAPQKMDAEIRLNTEMEEKGLFSFRLKPKDESVLSMAVFNDMFEFAYFFLASAIYNGAEMRKCENCGHLFEVTHQRQRFCPVTPGKKRSSCEMAYNNKRKKRKKDDN